MMAAAADSLKLSNLIPWYHGPITRNAAVSLLEAEGDFLVRDCISNPGDYVLTCMGESGKALHFKLNRVSLENNEEWYQFEGELFPSAVSLIEHHLSTLEPISLSSNAVITRPKAGKHDNAIYVKLNNHLDHRSQSSMSSTSASTASSGGPGGGMQLTKSGSRASLLKDTPKDCSTTPCELKRFKSLPASGRIRRVKRRAPSPPKDKKPFSAAAAVQSKEETSTRPTTDKKTTPPNHFLEGVKLRRKKFSQLIPKPLNLSQRQSLHVTTAHLHDYLKRSLPTCTLSKEKRRYSMPRLLDDSDDENEAGKDNSSSAVAKSATLPNDQHHQLVRSPSDTSLMYLSQLSSFFASAEETKRPLAPPSLPGKRRATRICTVAPQVQQQPAAVEEKDIRQREAIYDCLPKPRPCLTEEQIRFNEIYDVPRNLLISASKPSRMSNCHPDYFPRRSMSAFSRAKTATNSFLLLRQSECVSVCSGDDRGGQQRGCNPTMQQQELNGLNRHRNYVDDLHKDSGKPALPPKSRKGFYEAGKEELYDNPRHIMSNSDCISLCSNFSYCSQCTNTDSVAEPTSASASSTMSLLPPLNDEDSLRFSPTSLFSEDSVSLRDFDFDMPYLEAQRSGREYSCRSLRPEMSTLSSVSSVTLQGDDLSVDTISLPEDPFPHGLPSSASSTIGSPVSSRSSFSKSWEEDDLNALPFSQEEPNEEEKNLTKNGTFSETQLKDEELSLDDRPTSSSSTTTPTIEANLELEPLMPPPAYNEAAAAEAEEVGEESSGIAAEEEFDIFNHRSSSRLANGKVKLASRDKRCKSQPHSLDAMLRDPDDPIWMAHSHDKERKSLSPNVLKAMVAGEACSWESQSLFDPGSYMTLFLPITSHKPLDPMAVSAVHRTLVDTPAPLLAVHLTYLDLCFFGLLGHTSSANGKGRLHHPRPAPHRPGDLKRLSESWRYRLDTLERFLCLRTLVEMSILAASNLSESTRVLCKWIRVAEETERRLKNLFGFHCIIFTIRSSPYLRHWEGLWDQLKEEHGPEYNLLNGAISCSIEEMVTTADYSQSAGAITVPNVMPYVLGTLRTLKETSCIIEDLCEELIPLGEQPPQPYWSMTIDGFKKNAQMAFRHVNNFDDLLFDLFRTEFHIRLFWGTNGVTDFPHNFNERHTKFAKVLSALASICARQ